MTMFSRLQPTFGFGLICLVCLVLAARPPIVSKVEALQSTGAQARVVLGPPILSAYLAIAENLQHAVGISDLANKEFSRHAWLWDEVLGIRWRSIPTIGHSVSLHVEEVLRLRPDVVFTTPYETPIWQRIGIPSVVTVGFDARAMAASKRKLWLTIGHASGRLQRAESLASFADAALHSLILHHSTTSPVTVAVLRGGATASGWMRDGRYSAISDAIASAGGHLLGGRSGPLNVEDMLVDDPEVIIVASSEHNLFAESSTALPRALTSLRALRSRRVYLMPDFGFMNVSVDDILLINWLRELLVPTHTACSLRDNFRASYRVAYHYSLSDSEIDRLIRLSDNNLAYNYDRFARPTHAAVGCLGRNTSL